MSDRSKSAPSQEQSQQKPSDSAAAGATSTAPTASVAVAVATTATTTHNSNSHNNNSSSSHSDTHNSNIHTHNHNHSNNNNSNNNNSNQKRESTVETAAAGSSGDSTGSVLADYLLGDYKLSMWIPSDLAGRVVGKKGVVITNLQRETKARQINALSAVGDSLWVAVVIIGDWKSLNSAYHAVSDIVHGDVDDVVLEFTINQRKPFFIYGKNKMNVIKLISAKSSVRIFLPELAPRDQGHEKLPPMTLEGSFDNVKMAVSLLETEALSYRERHGDGYNKRVQSKPATGENVTKELNVLPTNKPILRGDARKEFVKDDTKLKESKHVGDDKEKIENISKEVTKSAADIVPKTDARKEDVKVVEDNKHVENSVTKEDGNEAVEKVPPECISSKSDVVPQPFEDSPALSVSKRLDIQKVINIPSSIVGLLLSKRPPVKVTVMNQIQNTTSTIISKIIIDGKTDDVSIRRRKDSTETIDSGVKSSASKIESDVEDDDKSFADLPTEDQKNIVSSSSDMILSNEKKSSSNSEVVVFRISGFATENVEAAFGFLERIVKGERIKEVMESLKIAGRLLPRRDNSNIKSKGEDRKPPLERKPSREKKVDKPPFDNNKDKDIKPFDNKPADKEGAWRKEKLAEKVTGADIKAVGERPAVARRVTAPLASTSGPPSRPHGEGRPRASQGSNKEGDSNKPTQPVAAGDSKPSDLTLRRGGKPVKKT